MVSTRERVRDIISFIDRGGDVVRKVLVDPVDDGE